MRKIFMLVMMSFAFVAIFNSKVSGVAYCKPSYPNACTSFNTYIASVTIDAYTRTTTCGTNNYDTGGISKSVATMV
ncbi:MAG: hypothetical protein NTX03_13555, partial [Bacteroidetes bacterium]|nr:hypothetical protein [Bacteroidota bacterium]